MLYLLEAKLPVEKSITSALTHVTGIGKNTAFLICKKLGFSLNFKVEDLSQDQVISLLKLTDSLNLVLNNDLKKLKALEIKNLVSMRSYRGIRRSRGLPVRGQRTHTNAKSSRKNKRM